MLPLRTDPSFPSALRASRLAKGLSKRKLGQQIGVSGVTVRMWEDPEYPKHAPPKQQNWLKLNRALGYEVDVELPQQPPQMEAPKVVFTLDVKDLIEHADSFVLIKELERRGYIVSKSSKD